MVSTESLICIDNPKYKGFSQFQESKEFWPKQSKPF